LLMFDPEDAAITRGCGGQPLSLHARRFQSALRS